VTPTVSTEGFLTTVTTDIGGLYAAPVIVVSTMIAAPPRTPNDEAYIGPLTTVYTPPSYCLTNEALTSSQSPVAVTQISGHNQTSYYSMSLWNNGPETASAHMECFPASYALDVYSYYSPGACPSGWAINTSSVVQLALNTSLATGDHLGVCCPTRYTYDTAASDCTSSLTALTQARTFQVINSSTAVAFEYVDVTAGTVWAGAIQIHWRDGDNVASLLPTSTSQPSTSSSSGPEGFSSGAKIGIGVGVPLAVLLLLGIAAFIFFRRRSKHEQDPQYWQGTGGAPARGLTAGTAAELYTENPVQARLAELPGHEAEAQGRAGKLQGTDSVNYMPGSTQPRDVYISDQGQPLELPAGATVA
jgi:hypothetical protein